MTPQYGPVGRRPWHHVSDVEWVVVASVVVIAVWRGGAVATAAGLVVAFAVTAVSRRPRPAVVAAAVVLSLLGVWRSTTEWERAVARRTGPFEGWARVSADPEHLGGGLKVVLEVEGERFAAWIFGGSTVRVEQALAGDTVWIRGERHGVADHRSLVRHVVGRLDVLAVGDHRPAGLPYRPGNRVRAALRATATETMAPEEAGLFRGLVIGDDADEPRWLLDAFRASGLSHLTAVSGQNVAYLLAGLAPLLRRLPTGRRWLATVGVVCWFALATRLEPSVLRAASMALLAVTAAALGRSISTTRSLAVSTCALVLLDPMLVWSVGFWLSVGATAGVALATPWWWRHLGGPDWWRGPLAVTLGAQCGVVVPSWWVFGRLPVVALGANLLAMPVAGAVMLVGAPAGLAARLLPEAVRTVVMWPLARATRWVRWVAEVAARLEPGGVATVMWWAAVLITLFLTRRRPPPVTP